jgi:hypothetical protein
MKKHSMTPRMDVIPVQQEAAVEDAQAGAAQVKVVDAEGSQEQCQQDAHHLVAAHGLILLVEHGLRIRVGGGAHGDSPRDAGWASLTWCGSGLPSFP